MPKNRRQSSPSDFSFRLYFESWGSKKLLWATPSKVIAETAQLLDDLFTAAPILFEKIEISEYC